MDEDTAPMNGGTDGHADTHTPSNMLYTSDVHSQSVQPNIAQEDSSNSDDAAKNLDPKSHEADSVSEGPAAKDSSKSHNSNENSPPKNLFHTPVPPPSLSSLDLGSSILSTPTRVVDPNLAKIRDAQRKMKEKMLAAQRDRQAANALLLGHRPLSLDSSVGTDQFPNPRTDNEEKEHKRLVAEWKRKNADFEKRRKNNTTTAEDEIEHFREQRAEEIRSRRYNECKKRVAEEKRHDELGSQHVDDGELFVGQRPLEPLVDDSDEAMTVGNHSEDDLQRSVVTKNKRKRKLPSHIDVDSDADAEMIAALTQESLPKRSKKGKEKETTTSTNGPKRGRPKGSKNTNPKAKSNSKKKSSAAQRHQLANIDSLYASNVIRDAGRNHELGNQPTFTSHRRNEAMKELIASLPQENRKTNQMDMQYVLSSLKDFLGSRAIKQIPDVGDGTSGFQLKGMRTALKHFQVLGSAFMRRRELSGDAPTGGIVADQMGLGKTVMMLANIADALAYRIKGERVCTLIIVTPALLKQWELEIKRHLDLDKLGRTRSRAAAVCVHASGSKVVSDNAESFLASHEFVLSTYDEVRRSFPVDKTPPAFQTAEEKKAYWTEYIARNKGILHRIEWARIVLDEAQAIKNRQSRTSIACRYLLGHYRWAISGTPIQNTVGELYPYFRFLNVPNTGNYRVFKENFVGRNDPDKYDRLQAFLNKILIRRMHKDRLFNQPLVKLPQPSEQVHMVEFNDFERSVYEIVRRRMIQRINQFSHKGELESNYRNVLVMMLRLRQLTGHVLAVQSTLNDLLELEDLERLRELAKDLADPNLEETRRHLLVQLRKALAKQHRRDRDNDESQELHETQVQHSRETEPGTGGAHGLSYDFGVYLDSLRQGQHFEELRARQMCAVCDQAPSDPWITSCYHVMCLDCLELLQRTAAEMDKHARCPECGDVFYRCNPLEDLELDSHQDSDKPPDWIELPSEDTLPSSKTVAIKAQILNWLEEDPNQKIIVYTQFLNMIRIMQRVCQSEGWGCETYCGKMTRDERDKVIEDFHKKPEVIMLLASLKSGGIGLNLTMASRVIVIDPWWNRSVEDQAFCRVYRIGQVHETNLTRFAVKNTIDEAMINMQDRKQEEIDEVMNDTKGRRNTRLSVREMMCLFGETREDDGKPFIMVDNVVDCPYVDRDTEDELFGDEE